MNPVYQLVGTCVVGDRQFLGIPLQLLAMEPAGYITEKGGFGQWCGESEVRGGFILAQAGINK